jgi:FAD:protein FMN transferase
MILVAIFLIALPYAGSADPPRLLRFEFEEPHMGTTWRIVMYASASDAASAASRSAFARIAELDTRLSDYNPTSELRTLEQNATEQPLPVSADLFRVLSAAQTLAAQTDGAFDVAVGTLTRLWRRARRLGELPPQKEIDAARAAAGHQHLELDAAARTVKLSAGVQLDLGGIAKGYAADEALRCLRAKGVTRAFVAGGGDIAIGDPPPGSPGWRVDASPGTVVLTHTGISTSGDTEQWLESGGVRYSHIIDPRTGGAMSGRRLVTVIAPNAITSDMLATAASVLALPEALRLIEATPGTAARIGTPEGGLEMRWLTSSRWPRGEGADQSVCGTVTCP